MCTHRLYKYVYLPRLPGPVAHGTPAGPEGPPSRVRGPLGPFWPLVSLGTRGHSGWLEAVTAGNVPDYIWDGGSSRGHPAVLLLCKNLKDGNLSVFTKYLPHIC